MASTVFGYLILISTENLLQFYSSVFCLILVLTEKIYQTLKTVSDHISKHSEVRQKYSAVLGFVNSLCLGMWTNTVSRV